MIPVLVSGAGVGLGVWLIWRALTAQPALAEVQAGLERPERPAAVPSVEWQRGRLQHRLAHYAIGRLRGLGFDPETRGEDLAITNTSVEAHVLSKLTYGLGGVVFVVVVAALLATAGVAIVPVGVVFLAAVGGAVGFVYPDLVLADRAKGARRAFRHAYGAYLDVVGLMVAAGSGPEGALQDAADAGDGPAFEAIREALDRAKRSRRVSMWQALGELGLKLGIVELGELAASAALVDSEGARIREALIAQADSLRSAQLAEIEAEAESTTERMTFPVMLLAGAFIVFLGYPALVAISQAGAP